MLATEIAAASEKAATRLEKKKKAIKKAAKKVEKKATGKKALKNANGPGAPSNGTPFQPDHNAPENVTA